MKKVNFPLGMGVFLLIVLFTVSFFPKLFTKIDPTTTTQFKLIKTTNENGFATTSIEGHPTKPDGENILGTDELGRDIYARLIYGTRTTLKVAILIVLFRLLIAVPMGLGAGIGVTMLSYIIRFFNTIFTAIPILFLSFFILNIKYITTLSVEKSTIVFAVVLSVLGWSKLARQIEEKASKIMNEEFIEGEIAVGKSKLQIAVQNMLPHLVPSLISFVFIEVGLVIFLLSQLSIFGIFIGPRMPVMPMEGTTPRWFSAVEPEWASMLSQMLLYNKIGKYWVGLYPALAFAVGILAFNLTGEGLKIEFEKRTSKAVSMIRNFGFIFSPRIYWLQLRRFKEYYKPVIMKTLSVIILLTYVYMPPPKSVYAFQMDEAISVLEELVKPEYEGRLAGHEGNYLAGEYIVSKLMEYGLEPYDGVHYVQNFPLIKDSWYENLYETAIVEDAMIHLKDSSGEIVTYQLHKDFEITTFSRRDIGKEDFMDGDGYISFNGVPINDVNEYVSMIKNGVDFTLIHVSNFKNTGYLLDEIFRRNTSEKLLSYISFATFEEYSPQIMPTFLRGNHIISAKGSLAEKLNSSNKYTVEVKIKPPKLSSNNGRNIFAVLPGADWDRPNDIEHKKEVIMIGASYDGTGILDGRASAIRASRAAMNLEIARVLSEIKEPLKKTIIFAFWDGETLSSAGSKHYNVYDRIFDQRYHEVYYFDIGYIGNDEVLGIDVKSTTLFKVDTYDMVKDIHKGLKGKKVKFVSRSPYSQTFYNIGENLYLKISAEGNANYFMDTDKDRVADINKKQMETMGQFFIDLITMNPHFK